MDAKEAGRELLGRTCEYLVALPFDVKVLQEAVADPDLDKGARELAAGVVHYVLSHQDSSHHERLLDSVFLVRLGFQHVREQGGDGADAFRQRFSELYGRLDEDLGCFQAALGPELWAWLAGRLAIAARVPFKGRKVTEYVDDQEALDQLYEDCLEFQTNFSVSEPQLRNRVRRPEQIVELLQRRHAEDSKRRP
jgi:hypothetical protein